MYLAVLPSLVRKSDCLPAPSKEGVVEIQEGTSFSRVECIRSHISNK